MYDLMLFVPRESPSEASNGWPEMEMRRLRRTGKGKGTRPGVVLMPDCSFLSVQESSSEPDYGADEAATTSAGPAGKGSAGAGPDAGTEGSTGAGVGGGECGGPWRRRRHWYEYWQSKFGISPRG
jgi:hypothetical protein